MWILLKYLNIFHFFLLLFASFIGEFQRNQGGPTIQLSLNLVAYPWQIFSSIFPMNSGPGLTILLNSVLWITNTNQLELARDETSFPPLKVSPCMYTDLPYAILDVSNGSHFMLSFPSVLKAALLFGYLPLKQFPIEHLTVWGESQRQEYVLVVLSLMTRYLLSLSIWTFHRRKCCKSKKIKQ